MQIIYTKGKKKDCGYAVKKGVYKNTFWLEEYFVIFFYLCSGFYCNAGLKNCKYLQTTIYLWSCFIKKRSLSLTIFFFFIFSTYKEWMANGHGPNGSFDWLLQLWCQKGIWLFEYESQIRSGERWFHIGCWYIDYGGGGGCNCLGMQTLSLA